MRLLGYALVLGGYLLCISGYLLQLSLFLAAIGFFLLGLGLICLLIAEERKRSQNPATGQLDGPNAWEESLQFREPAPVWPNKPPPNQNRDFFDHESWQSLVENDPDISRLVTVLAPYGQQYVDELARAYLVLNDKEYLPMIIKKIVKSATRGAEQDVTSARALQRLHDVLADSPELTSGAPRMDPVSDLPLPKQPARDVSNPGTSATETRAPTRDKADANRVANVTALKPEKKVTSATETDDNLADLLSKLDLRMGPGAKQ